MPTETIRLEEERQIFSYREALCNDLNVFIEKTQSFHGIITSEHLIEIAASVARHQEENFTFFPEVFICLNRSALTLNAPAGVKIHIIEESIDINDIDNIRKVMKKCAPLTSRDWCVFIEISKDKNTYSYGIFKPSSIPTSVSLSLKIDSTSGLPTSSVDIYTNAAIHVSSPQPSVVTFQSNCQKEKIIYLSHKASSEIRETLHDESRLNGHARRLRDAILDKVDGGVYEIKLLKTYLTKALEDALRTCHGAFICVIDKRYKHTISLPESLKTGSKFNPCIDFYENIGHSISMRPEEACTLISYFELIRRVISFDGITIFSNDGSLIGYNAFVHSNDKSDKKEIKGARKRAFNNLIAGKNILAAYYQSQNGDTAFYKKEQNHNKNK